MPLSTRDAKLKRLLKAAVVEVLEERPELVRDALAEAVEDIGMVGAIDAGSRSNEVSRTEIFKILERSR